MKRILTLLAFLAVAACASAQSLGEIAKKEKERRKNNGKEAVVTLESANGQAEEKEADEEDAPSEERDAKAVPAQSGDQRRDEAWANILKLKEILVDERAASEKCNPPPRAVTVLDDEGNMLVGAVEGTPDPEACARADRLRNEYRFLYQRTLELDMARLLSAGLPRP